MERIETLRITERDALLSRVRSCLEADTRVVAAWLYGSFGRGEQDAWSDLDVWIVLRDDAYDAALRHEYPAHIGEVVFTEEAPQNGPPGGTYLMSAHDAPTGPHLIDWYLQPLRYARRSESQVVLVDRGAIPETQESTPPREEFLNTPEVYAANKAALFWAMLLIQAKHIARKPDGENLGFEGFLLTLLGEVVLWRGRAFEENETQSPHFAGEKLDRLRRLSAEMAAVAPDFSHPRTTVERFFDTVLSYIAA